LALKSTNTNTRRTLRWVDLGVAFPFSVALAGAFFVDFDAGATFDFVVPVASCTTQENVKCVTTKENEHQTFFALVFVEEVFFFDAADAAFVGAVFFGAVLFVAAGLAAVAGLVVLPLSAVVAAAGTFFVFDLAAGAFLVLVAVGAGLTFGLAVVIACRVRHAQLPHKRSNDLQCSPSLRA
jgi:hypothetical protein